MISGRTFIGTSTIGVPFAPVAAEAQQTAKAHRIGWLVTAPLPTALDGLREGLSGLGYVEGTKAADLPAEQPAKFELVVSAKTARALGLTFPPSIATRVDHVIE